MALCPGINTLESTSSKNYTHPDNIWVSDTLRQNIVKCDVLPAERPICTDHILIAITIHPLPLIQLVKSRVGRPHQGHGNQTRQTPHPPFTLPVNSRLPSKISKTPSTESSTITSPSPNHPRIEKDGGPPTSRKSAPKYISSHTKSTSLSNGTTSTTPFMNNTANPTMNTHR